MTLQIDALDKSFAGPAGPVPVLRGIEMTVETGERLALTGESGSGKSTLLHLIGGLDRADAGRILLDGEDVSQRDDRGRAAYRREAVGIVFQQFNLIPTLSVADNIAFQARLAGRHDPDHDAALAEALGLTAHLRKFPDQLSGGQQQRVAIARALSARPRLVLADEPTGNLDEATARAVIDQMIALVEQTGASLLMVTHSPTLAARMDRQLHLKEGRIA